MTGVVREEGFWALFGGVGPAALRQVIYGGICTGFYKPLRRLMYPGEENQNLSFPKRLCVSLTTGITGQTCSLPLDLIKVRMQADGRLIMMGEKLAQTALWYGADDLDGTIVEERIGHMAGASSAQGMTISQLEHMIREAGFTPLRRNATFESVEANA